MLQSSRSPDGHLGIFGDLGDLNFQGRDIIR